MNRLTRARASPQRVVFHLRIFLSMSIILLVLVVWFINELQKHPPPTEEDKKKI